MILVVLDRILRLYFEFVACWDSSFRAPVLGSKIGVKLYVFFSCSFVIGCIHGHSEKYVL